MSRHELKEWIVEPLANSHNREAFDCGIPVLNDFLKKLVSQYEKQGLARAFVAVPRDEPAIVRGYFTLSAGNVAYDVVEESTRTKIRQTQSVVLIGRFGIDRAAQGQGLGKLMLIDALRRCLRVANEIGITAVEVDAKDDDAKSFYLKYGFEPLLDDSRHLFLPIKRIKAAGIKP